MGGGFRDGYGYGPRAADRDHEYAGWIRLAPINGFGTPQHMVEASLARCAGEIWTAEPKRTR
jgi:hypothetical protein